MSIKMYKTIIQKIEKKYVINTFSGNTYKFKYLKFKVLIKNPDLVKKKIIIKEHKINLNIGEILNLSSIVAIINIDSKK